MANMTSTYSSPSKEVYTFINATTGLNHSLLIKYLKENENALAFVVDSTIEEMDLPNNLKNRVTCFSTASYELDFSTVCTVCTQLFNDMIKKANLEKATLARFFDIQSEYPSDEREQIKVSLYIELADEYLYYFEEQQSGKYITAGLLSSKKQCDKELHPYVPHKPGILHFFYRLLVNKKSDTFSYLFFMPYQMKSTTKLAQILYQGDRKNRYLILPGFICKVIYYANNLVSSRNSTDLK